VQESIALLYGPGSTHAAEMVRMAARAGIAPSAER
jgi:hypothetical protein